MKLGSDWSSCIPYCIILYISFLTWYKARSVYPNLVQSQKCLTNPGRNLYNRTCLTKPGRNQKCLTKTSSSFFFFAKQDSSHRSTMHRVLVVGAGATGSAAALRLRQLGGKNVMVEVWEKARGPGADCPAFYKSLQLAHDRVLSSS